MNYNEIVGTTGVGLILIAFFCNTFGLVHKEGRLFFTMNMVGAALACYASWLIQFWPFVILEGMWTLVSIIGLARTFK